MINNYHDHKQYIQALANSIRKQWQDNEPGQLLVFSFHGIPKRYREAGDPYYHQCKASAELLAKALGLEGENR